MANPRGLQFSSTPAGSAAAGWSAQTWGRLSPEVCVPRPRTRDLKPPTPADLGVIGAGVGVRITLAAEDAQLGYRVPGSMGCKYTEPGDHASLVLT